MADKTWIKIIVGAVFAFFAWLAYFLSGKKSGGHDRLGNYNRAKREFGKERDRIKRERIQIEAEGKQVAAERTDIEGERDSIKRERAIIDRDKQLLNELERRRQD